MRRLFGMVFFFGGGGEVGEVGKPDVFSFKEKSQGICVKVAKMRKHTFFFAFFFFLDASKAGSFFF